MKKVLVGSCEHSTKVTYLGNGLWGCRVFVNGEINQEIVTDNKHKNMAKFNHMLDVAFSVVSEEEDPDKLTKEEMIAGLEKRLESLKADYEAEAFGHCDTYEED